ncbi:MAG: leucyl aminopeptidase family protein [Phycisphaerales bacterium]|nr:leucyl aminopeptidase family protein [Phycisphaerales bacterium]
MHSTIVRATSRSATIVHAAFSGERGPRPAPGSTKSVATALADAAATPGFRGELGEVVSAGAGRLLLGLGKRDELHTADLRTAGAKLVRAAERMRIGSLRLDLAAALGDAGHDLRTAGRAIGEGIAIGDWRVDAFDGAATNRAPRSGRLAVDAAEDHLRAGLERGLALGASVNYARGLAATPPNICTPAWVAQEARKLARRTGMSCRVIGYADAKRLGMGGLVNVGRASANKPCLVILEHKPRSAKGRDRIALVGKTLTYDTGGYSLKVNNGMKGMKYDKCGGTAVLGAMHAIANAKLPVHVTAFLPAAENMVAGDAYRPDDIITMHNGVSVEVTNTDAEGRLVLADALSYAIRSLKPTAVVDLATLTGGVVVALGSFSAGYFCNDPALRGRVEGAAERSGERVWQLPLWREHREFMRSTHADIVNSNAKREAHPIQGAAFLSYFVDEGMPWAHIDIAGVSAVDSPGDIYVTGPTGYGVRLLFDLVAE